MKVEHVTMMKWPYSQYCLDCKFSMCVMDPEASETGSLICTLNRTPEQDYCPYKNAPDGEIGHLEDWEEE